LESVLKRILGDDDGREDHRDVVARLAWKQARLVRELPEIGLSTKLHRVLKTAWSAVVRGERQMPVAVEQLAEHGQILRGCNRRLFRVGPLVNVPILPKSVLETGSPHELPHALGLRPRQGIWLERTLNERYVREIQRQPFCSEHVLNHRQI